MPETKMNNGDKEILCMYMVQSTEHCAPGQGKN